VCRNLSLAPLDGEPLRTERMQPAQQLCCEVAYTDIVRGPDPHCLAVKPCTGREAQVRVCAVIGRRKRENTTCCECERDRHTRMHRKNGCLSYRPIGLFYFICASLPIQGFILQLSGLSCIAIFFLHGNPETVDIFGRM